MPIIAATDQTPTFICQLVESSIGWLYHYLLVFPILGVVRGAAPGHSADRECEHNGFLHIGILTAGLAFGFYGGKAEVVYIGHEPERENLRPGRVLSYGADRSRKKSWFQFLTSKGCA
jgi:hypothetical protein